MRWGEQVRERDATVARRMDTTNRRARFRAGYGVWTGRLTDEPVASRLAQIPMGRAGSPDEVAAAVAYLAAPDAGWTTGQILQVNVGMLLGRG